MSIYTEKEQEARANKDKYPNINKALDRGGNLDAIEMEIQVGLGDAYYHEYVDLMGFKEK